MTALPRKESTKLGYIRNVRFDNINCCSENGILVYGDGGNSIRNISFEHITLKWKGKIDRSKNYYDLRPTFRENVITDFLYAVYLRNVAEIRFVDLSLELDADMKEEMGNWYSIQNCKNISILDGNGGVY